MCVHVCGQVGVLLYMHVRTYVQNMWFHFKLDILKCSRADLPLGPAPSWRLWVWQIGGVCGLGKGKMVADRRFTTLSDGNCVVNMHNKTA